MLQITHQTRPFESELADHLIGCYYPECGEFPKLPPHIDAAYLSTGYFSSVWAIPGEPFKVLKVSHRPDDACRQYMEWVFANPHPNAPKIHSIEHVDHLMYVVMDRYYPLEDNDDAPLCYRENVPGNQVLMGDRPPNYKLGHEQLCATIRRTFRYTKFDLHKDNVMQTRDGTIIITDPVSYATDRFGEIIYEE